MVHWLTLHTVNAGGTGMIPGQRTRPHVIIKSSHAGTKDPTCWDFPGGLVVKNPPSSVYEMKLNSI